MAVIDDLSQINVLSARALRITLAAANSTVLVDQNDSATDTQITLTPAQKAAILANRTALIAQIKTLAAGLP